MVKRKPAPIQIQSDILPSGRRVWMAVHNGELMREFRSGQAAINHIHEELVTYQAQRRESEARAEAQRKSERNAALAKGAIKILGLLASNINKNK